MRSVVGVTPSSEMSAPSNALTNADLPELNSPTMTSKNNSSRSESARRTRSTSSGGAPKFLMKATSLSRSSRSLSTSASRRSSSIRTPYTSLCMQALYTLDGFAMPRSWYQNEEPSGNRHTWRLRELQNARQDRPGSIGDRLRGLGHRRRRLARREGRRISEGPEQSRRPRSQLHRHGPGLRRRTQRAAGREDSSGEGRDHPRRHQDPAEEQGLACP